MSARPCDAPGVAGRLLFTRCSDTSSESGSQEPRAPIGIDKEGSEILSFVKGGGPSHTDDALARVAQLVRELHDATESFRAPQDARRQFMVGAPRVGDVVCHNDLSPDNTIYGSDRTPHAFIDWDLEGYPYRYVEIDEFTYWLTSGAGAGDIINRKPTLDAGWDD